MRRNNRKTVKPRWYERPRNNKLTEKDLQKAIKFAESYGLICVSNMPWYLDAAEIMSKAFEAAWYAYQTFDYSRAPVELTIEQSWESYYKKSIKLRIISADRNYNNHLQIQSVSLDGELPISIRKQLIMPSEDTDFIQVERLKNLVDRLHPRDKEIIVWIYYEGRTPQDLPGISSSTYYKRKNNALTALTKLCQETEEGKCFVESVRGDSEN